MARAKSNKNSGAAANASKGSTKAPKRAYHTDTVDYADVEKYLEDEHIELLSDLPPRVRRRAMQSYKKKQAVGQKSIDNLNRLIKSGAPLLYNVMDDMIFMPISKPAGLKSNGESNITISTNLAKPGAMEAAAALYLAPMRKAYTTEEIARMRAEEKERQKREAAERAASGVTEEDLDDATLNEWLGMNNDANLKDTVRDARVKAEEYQQNRKGK